MSYIHDALKKAQREKDNLTGKYYHIWSGEGIGRAFLKRDWLLSIGVIAIAFIFSSYAWFESLDDLAAVEPSNRSAQATSSVHRGRITAPMSTPTTGRPSVQSEKESASPQAPPVKRFPSVTPSTATNRTTENSQDLPQREKVTAEPSKPVEPQNEVSTAPAPPASGPGTLYDRALALQKAGRIEEAKKLYEAALRKTPNLVSALNNLAAIYIQEKNLDGARAILEKAIRIDPTYADAYYNLACIHAHKKDLARGIFYLKKTIALNPIAREWAKRDEDLRNLRDHTEYAEIVHGTKTS